jgi:hypothetical protein
MTIKWIMCSSLRIVGKPRPDQHWHEHATCFRLGNRSLVVIGSCGHAGVINTLRRAQMSAGSRKSTRWSAVSTWLPYPAIICARSWPN